MKQQNLQLSQTLAFGEITLRIINKSIKNFLIFLMFKRFHENFANVIAVSSCNQIYQHVLASWFTKARHQQQKEADYCKNKSFSKSSKCYWNMCKKLLEKTSYPESVVRRCSLKTMFLKISQIFQENTCAAISFLQ